MNSERAATMVMSSLKTYYALARNASILHKQTIIQDETLKKIFTDFSINPSPEMSLFFCKVLIVLSDHPQNAYMMSQQGYTQIVGTICEQPIPPKLIEKFLRVQSRLTKAQLEEDGGKRASLAERKSSKRSFKELTFVLPVLDSQHQATVSQCVLAVDGCISVSFRTDLTKEESRCFVRCKAYVETRNVANEIIKIGFEGVEFLYKSDDGNEELFTFYRDENTSPSSADKLPQYLDDNIEVFDPTTAVVTNNYKSSTSKGWLSSMLSFW